MKTAVNLFRSPCVFAPAVCATFKLEFQNFTHKFTPLTMWFKEEPSQLSMGLTAQSLICSIMEKLQGWMNVQESYSRALEQGTLLSISSHSLVGLVSPNVIRLKRRRNSRKAFHSVRSSPEPTSGTNVIIAAWKKSVKVFASSAVSGLLI